MNIHRILRISAFALIATLLGAVQGFSQAFQPVPAGQEMKLEGIIISRSADSFKMETVDGTKTYEVALVSTTSVKSNHRGVFRSGGNRYDSSYLLRGLRIKVEGEGNADGQLVAEHIRFKDVDLRAAQSFESRVAPLEAQAAMNTQRIGVAEERLTASEENARKMSGQIDETTSLANRAQATADSATAEAVRANNRINGLGEFDMVKTIVVPFATGKSTIGPKGKAIIDEAAAWVRTQDTKGWMVAIVGFADSTGRTAYNKSLSERRADAVIDYLVLNHNLPLHRLIQPFGAGIAQPVADNKTAAGRAQNRRVEIRLMVNKGIAGE
jgi:outer membrane protein OmpA-like peptidoglycan-associated protein